MTTISLVLLSSLPRTITIAFDASPICRTSARSTSYAEHSRTHLPTVVGISWMRLSFLLPLNYGDSAIGDRLRSIWTIMAPLFHSNKSRRILKSIISISPKTFLPLFRLQLSEPSTHSLSSTNKFTQFPILWAWI